MALAEDIPASQTLTVTATSGTIVAPKGGNFETTCELHDVRTKVNDVFITFLDALAITAGHDDDEIDRCSLEHVWYFGAVYDQCTMYAQFLGGS